MELYGSCPDAKAGRSPRVPAGLERDDLRTLGQNRRDHSRGGVTAATTGILVGLASFPAHRALQGRCRSIDRVMRVASALIGQERVGHESCISRRAASQALRATMTQAVSCLTACYSASPTGRGTSGKNTREAGRWCTNTSRPTSYRERSNTAGWTTPSISWSTFHSGKFAGARPPLNAARPLRISSFRAIYLYDPGSGRARGTVDAQLAASRRKMSSGERRQLSRAAFSCGFDSSIASPDRLIRIYG